MQDEPTDGGMNRRHFLYLTVTAAITGCQTVGTSGGNGGGAQGGHVVDAGPVGNYAADGVYSTFRDEGFFIICKEGKLIALSSYCTHRKCKLTAETDHSFYCPCHGSTFDPGGKVTEGPAKKDLPVLVTSANANSHLLVKM